MAESIVGLIDFFNDEKSCEKYLQSVLWKDSEYCPQGEFIVRKSKKGIPHQPPHHKPNNKHPPCGVKTSEML